MFQLNKILHDNLPKGILLQPRFRNNELIRVSYITPVV